MECGKFCKELGVACIRYLKAQHDIDSDVVSHQEVVVVVVGKKKGARMEGKGGRKVDTRGCTNELEML